MNKSYKISGHKKRADLEYSHLNTDLQLITMDSMNDE